MNPRPGPLAGSAMLVAGATMLALAFAAQTELLSRLSLRGALETPAVAEASSESRGS